jgi:hypothetical protein
LPVTTSPGTAGLNCGKSETRLIALTTSARSKSPLLNGLAVPRTGRKRKSRCSIRHSRAPKCARKKGLFESKIPESLDCVVRPPLGAHRKFDHGVARFFNPFLVFRDCPFEALPDGCQGYSRVRLFAKTRVQVNSGKMRNRAIAAVTRILATAGKQ